VGIRSGDEERECDEMNVDIDIGVNKKSAKNRKCEIQIQTGLFFSRPQPYDMIYEA
jgi:hypothetical protein